MDSKLHNNLYQEQKMVLNPKMIEELSVLQMSNVDLIQYVENSLVENPLLEADVRDISEFDEKISYLLSKNYSEKNNNIKFGSEEVNDFTNYVSSQITLRQYLISQLGELKVKDVIIKKLVVYFINNIDENGYLDIECFGEIKTNYKKYYNKVKPALRIIQNFEPAGVGARTLKECLIIQIKRKGVFDENLKLVITNYLEFLAGRKYNEIMLKTGIKVEKILWIHNLIKKLDPKPGQKYSYNPTDYYIKPELMVKYIDGEYRVIFINESIFNLRINKYYKEILTSEKTKNRDLNQVKTDSEKSESSVKTYIEDKLLQALNIMRAVEQRKKTILNASNYIIKYQEKFLKNGYSYLKPLTMRMVADDLSLHESTISRAINGKYIVTPRGTFELKFFFSSHIKNIKEDGISGNAVKKLIEKVVKDENKKKPFSDEQIRVILKDNGVEIARRTVSKYREALSIKSASYRKTL